ncbi:major facilitator transporter [Paenarthrobacter nicotinovorans]|nr:major facilitator transporter [Paenarthrobacter nicotinovorans]
MRHHNYRIFVALSLVGGGGVWMQRLAQDWLVLQLTGNSFSSPGRRRVQP